MQQPGEGINPYSIGICVIVGTILEGIIGAVWYGLMAESTLCTVPIHFVLFKFKFV